MMAEKELFTDRRWHDPPVVKVLHHPGQSKNRALEIAAFLHDTGMLSEERYQERLAEIEEKFKGHDPNERIPL